MAFERPKTVLPLLVNHLLFGAVEESLFMFRVYVFAACAVFALLLQLVGLEFYMRLDRRNGHSNHDETESSCAR